MEEGPAGYTLACSWQILGSHEWPVVMGSVILPYECQMQVLAQVVMCE